MEKHLKIAGVLAKLYDSQFKFGKYSFGIEPVIGVIPVVGDVIGLVLSFYIYGIALKMNISGWDKFKMLINIILDFLLGLIPIIGDLFDFGFKANSKNFKILSKYREGKFIDGEVV